MQKTTRLDHTTLRWTVFDSLDTCGPMWRSLQEHAVMTVFQRYEWLNAWYETIGRSEYAKPIVVAGIADESVKILFPLSLDRQLGAKTVGWLASDWCDYTMPLIAPDFAEKLTETDVGAMWRTLNGIVGDVDFLQLEKQPLTVGDYANPFARYETREFTADAYALKLGDDWERFYAGLRSSKTRRRLREKEKRLQKAGDLQFRQLSDRVEIRDSVSTMLDWKVAQIVAKGMFNPFSGKDTDEFLVRVASMSPRFARFYSLELDGEMLACCFALVDRASFTIFQTAYGLGPHSRHSPGRILINRMMEAAIEEGLEIFDFSLGDEPYKLDVCDIRIELMQSARAVSAAGWLPALLYNSKTLAKRRVKASERLSEAVFAFNRNAYRLGFRSVDREFSPQYAVPVTTQTVPGKTVS